MAQVDKGLYPNLGLEQYGLASGVQTILHQQRWQRAMTWYLGVAFIPDTSITLSLISIFSKTKMSFKGTSEEGAGKCPSSYCMRCSSSVGLQAPLDGLCSTR